VASRLARLSQDRGATGTATATPPAGAATAAPLLPDATAAAPGEVCDLCAAPVAPDHRHLVDVSARRLLCVCRACKILFDRGGAAGGNLRLVPERRRSLEGFVLDEATWTELRIPVDMAFFFHSTPAERVIAQYPSPMGATESLLELEAWTRIEAGNPVLGEMEPDTEALLVSRARGMREQWLVPINDCYELVGLIRTRWKGLSGGPEVWEDIERFFDDLRTKEAAC
jgi:hypothetical protein